MKRLIKNFTNDEQGQDLIEYTLLIAFVELASPLYSSVWEAV